MLKQEIMKAGPRRLLSTVRINSDSLRMVYYIYRYATSLDPFHGVKDYFWDSGLE